MGEQKKGLMNRSPIEFGLAMPGLRAKNKQVRAMLVWIVGLLFSPIEFLP